jgi:hypothetical protein
MVADQQQKRFASGETAGAMNRVSIPERVGLFHELEAIGMTAGRCFVGLLVPRANDHADLLHAGFQNLLYYNGQRRFLNPVAIDESLEWERALTFTGSGDDSFFNFHGKSIVKLRRASLTYSIYRVNEPLVCELSLGVEFSLPPVCGCALASGEIPNGQENPFVLPSRMVTKVEMRLSDDKRRPIAEKYVGNLRDRGRISKKMPAI